MSFNTAFRKRTICEVLREMNDIVFADVYPDELDIQGLERRIEEAMDMAKRMNKKLIGYKRDWDKDMDWKPNLDQEEDLKRRQAR